MPWQPPHAEMHFTLIFLQEHLLVVQSTEQLQETNRSKFAGATSTKVIIGSNCPALVTYHPYNLGSLDIFYKSIQSCICRYALRECCIAEQFVGGRLAGWMTLPFVCLLYLHKRFMDYDVAGILYMNWKINIPALRISSMEVVSQ